jgi:hypothetical protein
LIMRADDSSKLTNEFARAFLRLFRVPRAVRASNFSAMTVSFWISEQDGSREFQKRRILDFNGTWRDHIAETDIYLHRDPSTCQSCMKANTHAFVLDILLILAAFTDLASNSIPSGCDSIAHTRRQGYECAQDHCSFVRAGRCPSWNGKAVLARQSTAAHLSK